MDMYLQHHLHWTELGKQVGSRAWESSLSWNKTMCLRCLVRQMWGQCVLSVLAAWDGTHGFISATEQQTLFVAGESNQSKSPLWRVHLLHPHLSRLLNAPRPWTQRAAPSLPCGGHGGHGWRVALLVTQQWHKAQNSSPKNCVRALSEVHHAILISAFSKEQHKLVKICSMNFPTKFRKHSSCRLPWWNSVSCLVGSGTQSAWVSTAWLVCSTETHPALGFLGLYWQGRHPSPGWGMFWMAELQWADDRDLSLF